MNILEGARNALHTLTSEKTGSSLTMSDTTALSGLPGIVAVAPEVDSFRQLAYLGNNANGRIGGGIGIMNIMMASLRPIEALRYE